MTKHTKKSGKTLISCLMGKIHYFRVFPLLGGMICHMMQHTAKIGFEFEKTNIVNVSSVQCGWQKNTTNMRLAFISTREH